MAPRHVLHRFSTLLVSMSSLNAGLCRGGRALPVNAGLCRGGRVQPVNAGCCQWMTSKLNKTTGWLERRVYQSIHSPWCIRQISSAVSLHFVFFYLLKKQPVVKILSLTTMYQSDQNVFLLAPSVKKTFSHRSFILDVAQHSLKTLKGDILYHQVWIRPLVMTEVADFCNC